jgi:hypothetical protein
MKIFSLTVLSIFESALYIDANGEGGGGTHIPMYNMGNKYLDFYNGIRFAILCIQSKEDKTFCGILVSFTTMKKNDYIF